MHDTFLASRRWLGYATQALAIVGFAGLVAICLVTMYDGLARYFGLARVPGFRDFGEVVFAVLIASCFPIGLLRNQNITITFLGTALGKRATKILNLFSAIATAAGVALIAYAVIQRSGGLGIRTTRTGYMIVAPWAWTAAGIITAAALVQFWVVAARVAEALGTPEIIDDRGGATESGMDQLADEALVEGTDKMGDRRGSGLK
ncbi:MAG: TRAP transporter small permease subunit [Salinarimonadaceae bacterium]|nr:MAG: TRAP transporter small permease subunit [Salinarimonadaceae bacterium]